MATSVFYRRPTPQTEVLGVDDNIPVYKATDVPVLVDTISAGSTDPMIM